MAIENNKRAHTVTVRVTANATITVAGGPGVSDIATATEDTIVGAAITKIVWTTDAKIDIKRGANTVFTMPAGSTDQFDLRDLNMPIQQDPTATLVIATAAAANCTVMIELTKRFA